MKTKNSYAVLGLGRYGYAVAKELVENGADVLVVDSDEQLINDIVDEFPICRCADITDADAIKQLGISNIDVAIVAVASNLETSVMATTLCKDMGVKTVITKCANEMQCRILSKVGADKVVLPEYEVVPIPQRLYEPKDKMTTLPDAAEAIFTSLPNMWLTHGTATLWK